MMPPMFLRLERMMVLRLSWPLIKFCLRSYAYLWLRLSALLGHLNGKYSCCLPAFPLWCTSQDELIQVIDPQVDVDVQPWIEEVMAMHFSMQRTRRCPSEPSSSRKTPPCGLVCDAATMEDLWRQDASREFAGPVCPPIPRLSSFRNTHYMSSMRSLVTAVMGILCNGQGSIGRQ